VAAEPDLDWEEKLNSRRYWVAVGAITVLAAAVRVLGLDAKGFWEDEARSIVALRMDFGDMVPFVLDNTLLPPLYFLLAWPWTQVFGYGEVGLRSLSVLLGTATVPVAYLAARELVSRRAGIIVAFLVAVNPLLVWYSQEGRPYALAVLLSTAALLYWGHALRDPRPKWLALWALSSILAMTAHYFAAFVFVPEAVWLLATWKRRLPVLIAAGAPLAAGLALTPLAFTQTPLTLGGDSWIRDIPLFGRVVQVPGFFLVGFEVPYPLVLGLAAVAVALAAGGLWLLMRRGDPSERRGGLVAGSVGLAALVLPVPLAVIGLDFYIYRYLIVALLPFAVVVGAGFGAARAGRLGTGLAAGLVVLSLGIVVATASEPKFQRETWREAAEALGVPEDDRVVVVTPGGAAGPLPDVYLPHTRVLEGGAAMVVEVDVLALPRREELGAIGNPELPAFDGPPRPPARGYELVDSRRTEDFLLLRYRAPAPRPLSWDQLVSSAVDQGVAPLVLVEGARPDA
jgi:mannosyltransferase